MRARIVGRTENMANAVRIGNEVETLYTNGPAGGGALVGIGQCLQTRGEFGRAAHCGDHRDRA